jgi:translation initiation factor IF-2
VPIRIYALAKELQVDSKKLVDLCARAGITGKGSALASLEDAEVEKVKAFIAGATAKKAPTAPVQPPRQAPKQILTLGPGPSSRSASPPVAKVAGVETVTRGTVPAPASTAEALAAVPAPVSAPTLLTSPPTAAALAEVAMPTPGPASGDEAAFDVGASPEPVAPVVAVSPAASLVAEQPPVLPTAAKATPVSLSPADRVVEPAPQSEPPQQPAAAAAAPKAPTAPVSPAPVPPREYSRSDYIGPLKSTGKIKVLGPKASTERKPEEGKPTAEDTSKLKKRREPVINLARLPEVRQPQPVKPAVVEPPAQKPEIRLPKDAIAGHKRGTRAPLEHLTKSAEKAKLPVEKKAPAPPAPKPAEEPGAGGKGGPPRVVKKGKAKDEELDRTLAGMATARVDRQKARKSKVRGRTEGGGEEETQRRARPRRTLTRKGTNTAAPRKGKVTLELPCTVRTFSEAAGVGSAQVQRTLLGLGVMATINSPIEAEYVELLAAELGVELEFRQKESLEDSLITQLDKEVDTPESLETRPPIITFLGHVDHGKTSLLDRIIGTNVVSGEAGGITQHIRAYTIEKGGRRISFVDTPGHEAFTEMRARGANVTDIAVLVVAADDGVMPQTEEAISHIKAAGVPIVVALNKIDLPSANVNQAMQQLAAKELLPSEWGGDVEVVKTSATKGTGIDELIETLFTIAELNEYRANPHRAAKGVCLEAQQEPGRGVVAKVIVRNGTMRVGDIIVCGAAHGRVKAMYDTLRVSERVEEAPPSTPVNVTGLDIAPQAGDAFHVLDDISKARMIAEQRASRTHAAGLSGTTTKVSFERFQELLSEGRLGKAEEVSTLNLIIRADVQGSIEAILKELDKFDHPEVQIKVLQASVGGITIGDVHLADASNGVVVGFNVIPDEAARALAEERHIEIRRYDIIYKLTDDIKALLEGKLKPEERVVELGRALVKQVFPISRVGMVAGCYVAQGSIQRGCRIRVNRDGRTIGDYALDSLRREKEDVREVPRGMECGIRLAGFNDIKQDDILEAYKVEEVARTL